MEFSVQNLCGFLIRSKLMSPDGVQAMYQRWQAEAKEDSASPSRFTKWLIANKYVTEYQAGLLAKGHADDFFLNQYTILERLGRGRMAGVYKAAHPLGQVVAIKVLPPSKAKNSVTFSRFQREAQLSMKLKHPNVVRAFQLDQVGELHYLVMEFLEGETLDEVLQRRSRLPPAEAVRLIHQALTGLQHIHEQGVVHRDLKPANLMLVGAEPDSTLKATIKILDIGLARQLFDESLPENRLELTAEGVLLGTPDYLAPEQARDPRTIDIRADIYSLGCVLYHTLAGQPPFLDKNLLSQLVRHANEMPKPLKEFNPQIPDGLQQIVNWMMAKKPDERYPTPERAAQALQMFLLADNVPAQAIEQAPQMRSYLTWLEKNEPSESDTVDIPPGSAPAVAKTAPKPQTPAAAPTLSSVGDTTAKPTAPAATELEGYPLPHRKSKKHKRHRHRATTPVATAAASLPVVSAVAAAPVEFDVELVPAMPLTEPLAAHWWPLKQRDWALVGIGAGAAAILGAAILAILRLAS